MRRTVTTIALAAVGLLGLAACGSDETPTGTPAPTTSVAVSTSSESVEESTSEESTTEESTSEESTSSEESTETEESTSTESSESADDAETGESSAAAGGATGSVNGAPWATPILNPGEALGTVSGDGIDVTVYQAGTAPATKTGNFANPDTNEPIIAVGAELVFVTYLVTNTGTEPLPLGSSLVNVDARYSDWPYLGGMDGITDFELTESMGINRNAVAEISDPPIYVLNPGESYTVGENFLYQAGSELELDVTVTPVDDEGDLVHDLRAEFEGSVTIA